jgi:hypothetical protein
MFCSLTDKISPFDNLSFFVNDRLSAFCVFGTAIEYRLANDYIMLPNNHVTKDLLLCIPVITFLAIVDKAVWPLILVLAVPMILARYYPSRLLDSVKRSLAERTSTQLSTAFDLDLLIKPVHLIVVASAICLLNTSPKKLEIPVCKKDMAISIEQQPTMPLRNIEVISLLLPTIRFE